MPASGWGTIGAPQRPSRNQEVTVLTLAQEVTANFSLSIPGLLALIAGILILAVPRMLNYIVAVYLIVIGVLQLFDLTF